MSLPTAFAPFQLLEHTQGAGAAEAIRSRYNYSGGYDGSDRIGWGANPTTDIGDDYRLDASDVNRWTAPEYESEYLDNINSLMDQLLNREEFNYNPQTDQLYDVYKQACQREGQRATEDALGNAAILSGGMPSTAAVTAATQAGDYYAAQLSDRIPQLEQNAYDRYVNDYNMDANTLSMLQSLDDSAYSRYANDRAFDYQQWMDDYNIDLSNLSMLQTLDDTAYNRFMNQLQYAADQDAANFEKDYNMAALAAEYGDYSYLRKMGIDTSALERSVGTSSGSGSGSSSSGGGYGYDPEIEALQKALVEAGYDLAVDGIYGPATQQAYEDYQNKNSTGGSDDDPSKNVTNQTGPGWIRVAGYSRLSWTELATKVSRGEIIESQDPETGKYTYRKNPNYNG